MYTGSHRRSDSISLHSFQEIHRPSSTRGVPIGLGVPVFTNPGTPLSHSRVFYPRGGGGGGSNAYHGMGVSGDTPRASPCPSRPFTPQGSLRSFSGGSVETGSDVSEEVVEAVELTPQERYNLALKKALAERETLSRAKSLLCTNVGKPQGLKCSSCAYPIPSQSVFCCMCGRHVTNGTHQDFVDVAMRSRRRSQRRSHSSFSGANGDPGNVGMRAVFAKTMIPLAGAQFVNGSPSG